MERDGACLAQRGNQSLQDDDALRDHDHRAVLADALQQQTQIPVILWDESFSTQDARATRIEMGVPRNKRAGHLDELAAVMILRSYIESQIQK